MWRCHFLFLSLALFSVSVNSLPRIVGGKDTTIEKHPYMLSLEYYGVHNCGASLLSNNYVITAAHCLEGQNEDSLTIRAGTSLRNYGGVVVGIKKLIRHPVYNEQTVDNDIAILELATPLEYSETIQPVKVINAGVDVTGKIGVVTGWGKLYEDGDYPIDLQELEVSILSKELCNSLHNDLTDNMMCGGYLEGGKDSCRNDSGGPLVVGDTLVGLVSWGEGCARPNKPGIYTRVANYREFIRKNTQI